MTQDREGEAISGVTGRTRPSCFSHRGQKVGRKGNDGEAGISVHLKPIKTSQYVPKGYETQRQESQSSEEPWWSREVDEGERYHCDFRQRVRHSSGLG